MAILEMEAESRLDAPVAMASIILPRLTTIAPNVLRVNDAAYRINPADYESKLDEITEVSRWLRAHWPSGDPALVWFLKLGHFEEGDPVFKRTDREGIYPSGPLWPLRMLNTCHDEALKAIRKGGLIPNGVRRDSPGPRSEYDPAFWLLVSK